MNETLQALTWLGGGLILIAVLLLTQRELRRTQSVVIGKSGPGI